jgi:putative transposase
MQPRAQALGVRKFDQAPAGAKEIMAQTSGNVVVHLVFSTKERRPLIAPELAVDLFAYLGGIIHEMRATALIINGTSDHVHMLVRIRPSQSVSEIARVVKTNSSRWAHRNGRPRFGWQAGYGVFSVSESNVPAVTKYIASQEEHHKKRSFQEEFVAFLKKNDVAYDERYIWEQVSFAPGGLAGFLCLPRACALGCILSPLRGLYRYQRRTTANHKKFRLLPTASYAQTPAH